MRLKVQVNDNNYFSILLSLLKDVHPFSELRKRELEVLAEILKYNELYKGIPKEDRMKVLFNYETRLKIADNLGITRETLYNLMKTLRDKGVLEYKSIANGYDKSLTKYKELSFEFIYEEDDDEKTNS
jgi:hypothetical protein